MRRLPIICLASCILLSSTATLAQTKDTIDTQEKGFPWIAHSSVDAFYLHSPLSASGTHPYQVSTYQAFTIQSLTFAWFHMGWRSRETMAPEFDKPYREPFDLKLAVTAEILRDMLFISLSGNIPLYADTIAMQDSAALSDAINGYNPLPYPNFISPRALKVGAFGNYSWTNWAVTGGVTYTRPAQYEIILDNPFIPASYFDIFARGVYQTHNGLHRFDGKATLYGQEQTSLRTPAHQEGGLYQLRYGYLRSKARLGWQLGGGLAIKTWDQNRYVKITAPLQATQTDDNLQRAYAEISLAWVPHPDLLWRVNLLPKILFNLNGQETGQETELGVSMGLKLWDIHRLRVSGSTLIGNYAGQTYVGFGLRAEFAFRHLGFQDLEESPDVKEIE